MCLQYIKLKTKNDAGLRYAYVPCGHCADCRKKLQDAWKFRLNAEFLDLKKRGWKIAFCTLTYSEDSLPTVPDVCFRNPSEYREIICFDRATVKDWIDRVRHWMKYHYKAVGEDRMRYFIASEYGSLTHRPHYHAILAWRDSCSYEEMHAVCSHFWTKGYLFPRDPRGDGDCLPFEVVGDASKALAYVSKYACKDIDYIAEVGDIKMYADPKHYDEGTDERAFAKLYKNCLPFHMQSQQLGFGPILRMTDEEKAEVLAHGMDLQGDGEHYTVPMYVKNKIVYDNYYIIDENGKRLCRRQASAFFEKYRQEIFERKAEFYHHYLAETSGEWLKTQGMADSLADKLGYALSEYRTRIYDHFGRDLDFDHLMGKTYLAFHHIDDDHCFYTDLCEQWMQRYRKPELAAQQMRGCDLVDPHDLTFLRDYWEMVDAARSYVGVAHLADREAEDRLTKRIRNFFNEVL